MGDAPSAPPAAAAAVYPPEYERFMAFMRAHARDPTYEPRFRAAFDANPTPEAGQWIQAIWRFNNQNRALVEEAMARLAQRPKGCNALPVLRAAQMAQRASASPCTGAMAASPCVWTARKTGSALQPFGRCARRAMASSTRARFWLLKRQMA